MAKFRDNSDGILSEVAIDGVVTAVLGLASAPTIGALAALITAPAGA